MIGQTISHYKILEKLGEGGMGVVYKAEDTKLKRTVALKFLLPHLAQDEEAKKRFIREAQAAATLSHPNIITVYEIGEFERQVYISNEHLDGQTLEKFLSINSVPVNQAIEFAIAIADALAYSHRKGVIHRDIKPGNIMVLSKTYNHVYPQIKIMDFGMAIILGDSKLTTTGIIVGTLTYMSPEQARGEIVDHRSDIFSFGAVLYEMLAGSPPFSAQYEAAILYKLINEAPLQLSKHRPHISQDLEAIVEKALMKDPRERYQSMDELLANIASYQYKPQTIVQNVSENRISIAVLPFHDISPGKNNEYLADGMTEELITSLSQKKRLRVIARTSVIRYKGRAQDIRDIGKELGVSYVMEGSVRRFKNSLRISTQLINANDGFHIWADEFDGVMKDIFSFQEEVAFKVGLFIETDFCNARGDKRENDSPAIGAPAESAYVISYCLRSVLDKLGGKKLPKVHKMGFEKIPKISAYEYLLQGKILQDIPTTQNLDNSISIIKQALEVSPRYADAFGSLANGYLWYVDTGLRPDLEYLTMASQSAEQALKIDNGQPDALYVMANLKMKKGDIKEAFRGFSKVIEMNPNHCDARLWRGILLYSSSFIEEALHEADCLLLINPVWPMAHWLRSTIRLHLGMFDAAVVEYEQIVDKIPSKLVWLALAYSYAGKKEKAWEVARMLKGLEPEGILWQIAFAFLEGSEGKGKQIVGYIDHRVKSFGWNFHIVNYWVASLYALAGEIDEAFHWLERGIAIGNCNFRWWEIDPNLKELRKDLRYNEILFKAKDRVRELEVFIMRSTLE